MATGPETIVWKNITTKGFWHKRIAQALELTNYNVILNDLRIPLSDIDNVIVSDTHSISHGSHMTIGTGGYYARSYMGFSNSTSNQIGTVMWMQNGVPRMTWTNISDPTGLARLASYEIKQQKNVTAGMSMFQN